MYSRYRARSASFPGSALEIVLAVRQAQPSLHQESGVGLLSVDALLHGEPQHAGGLVDAESHRVDVGAHAATQQACELRLVRDLLDAIEQRLERRETPGLDGGLVQVGGVEVRDLARRGAGRRGAGGVEQRRDAAAGQFLELVAGPPSLLARRDRGGLEPAAVGVGEEIVAGGDARVHRALEPRRSPAVRRLRGGRGHGPPRERRREEDRQRGSGNVSSGPAPRERVVGRVEAHWHGSEDTGGPNSCRGAGPTTLNQFRTSLMPGRRRPVAGCML